MTGPRFVDDADDSPPRPKRGRVIVRGRRVVLESMFLSGTPTLTSDDPLTANGEYYEVTFTSGAAVNRTSARPV